MILVELFQSFMIQRAALLWSICGSAHLEAEIRKSVRESQSHTVLVGGGLDWQGSTLVAVAFALCSVLFNF